MQLEATQTFKKICTTEGYRDNCQDQSLKSFQTAFLQKVEEFDKENKKRTK